MTRGEVRMHAVRVVFHALRSDFVVPLVGVLGTAVFTAVAAIVQLLTPSDGNEVQGVLAIVFGGGSIVFVFGMSIVVDFAIGVRGWRNALPRPVLDVKTMPRSYRT